MNCKSKLKTHMLLFLLSVFMPLQAMANITLLPTRVIFGDRDRFAEVTLVNTSDKASVYNIDWQFYKMLESGPGYKQVDASLTEFDLTKHIVFTPRKVTLAPGAKQKVRIALRRPPEIPPGEYRAHLTFSDGGSPLDSGVGQNDSNKGQQRAGATVDVKIGFSIPIILDVGTPDVAANIDSLSLERDEKGNLMGRITISRSGGPYGAIGHLFIYNDKDEVVGEVSNAHIFPEVNKREYVLGLDEAKMSGSLRATLKRHDYKTKGDSAIYTERVFPVQ